MIRIDGCESVVFSDGSAIINTADGRYLCLDYSDINILYKEMSMQLETKGLKLRLPDLEGIAGIKNHR
jgi:hypothetical protein